MEPSSKRPRDEEEPISSTSVLECLSRPISPPRKKKTTRKVLGSPWQLTHIRDLPEELNQNAVSLHDLLGDPLISECWEFNYLHDIKFLMEAFDPDTRHLVKVHIVHGFWKQDDPSRQFLAVRFNLTRGSILPPTELMYNSKKLTGSITLIYIPRLCQKCLGLIIPR